MWTLFSHFNKVRQYHTNLDFWKNLLNREHTLLRYMTFTVVVGDGDTGGWRGVSMEAGRVGVRGGGLGASIGNGMWGGDVGAS